MRVFRTVLLSTLIIIAQATQSRVPSQPDDPKTALLLIDIQDFYFPGGTAELVNPERASLNAQKLLLRFRQGRRLIIHVRHNSEPGGDIHDSVRPVQGEKIISKDHVNCFRDTDLLSHLKAHEVKRLIICGMMTHMCVEAAVRAAHDLGFEILLVRDACATRALTFDGKTVPAEDVQASTLSTLSRTYARVIDTVTYLNEY